jgi:hypothetical protein
MGSVFGLSAYGACVIPVSKGLESCMNSLCYDSILVHGVLKAWWPS